MPVEMPDHILSKLSRAMDQLKGVFRKRDTSKNTFGLGDLAFFFQFVRPVWKLGVLSLILTVAIAAFRSMIPLGGKVFIDFIVNQNGFEAISDILTPIGLGSLAPAIMSLFSSLNLVIALLLIAGIFYGLMQVVQGYLTAKYQQELTFNLETQLFDHVLRFPLTFFKNKQTGYLMSRVSDDVDTLEYLFSSAISQILSSGMYVIFGAAILILLDVKLAIIMACMFPVYLLIRYFFFARIRALSYSERESHAELSQDMQEVLSGVEVVKSHATEEKEVARVSDRLRKVIQVRLNNTILMSTASSVLNSFQYLLLLVIMIVSVGEIRSGAMTIGDLVAFIGYVLTLTGSVNSLFYTYLSFQPVFASMDRLKEMFSIVPEFERQGNNKALLKPDRVTGNIKYAGVSFAYNVNEPVLKDISFEVKPGEVVALVGPSGAGKTTMINLLLKLYIPQSGAIYLDGNDLNKIDHAWLRKQIGIVSQDIFLFNDTIENNIKYGKASATREEVIEAAKKAHIHNHILQMPDGYDTVIGERGAKMSVGQRQRISIAREFLKDAPILILDEPTSSVDTETERSIKESMKELTKGKTTFIISHRMTLANMADKIIVIENGKVVQTGSHQELVMKDGLYKTFFSTDAAESPERTSPAYGYNVNN
ncbi:ABC transporter permease/ATP binding protein [Methanocella paludicola SANAE]|uniref:ABC transporter permease/ATP binding protein n=1 Tax=Methanocella paludicola (strain DSM 17711 / JCM 13418 / NBRC 101707 / SANAE) TaxID=304371 RepID=D1YWY0_METPS|nr:ABC transporter ATP-binding protein [Methanocella paludicola]BAI60952.1 ABC transporter permease/ATP binding protein [Methanocella paludicola SANAE]